jgi:beta-glucosidase
MIDESVRRILTVKYRLGLFDRPYSDTGAVPSQLVNSDQRAAAREAAVKSAVLLRNQGNLLPLRQLPKSLAVIGPLADSKVDIGGSWSLASHPSDNVSVLEGIRKYYANTPDAVRFGKGVEIERRQESIFDAQFPEEQATLHTDEGRKAAFQHAIDLVKSSDVTVLVLGEAQNMSGERASRLSLDLPGRQEELMEAAIATGKPVVLVLLNGRPLAINWAASHVPAILEAWYPGTEGGNAVADLLFGRAVPGGKLPVTFPRSAGQEPLFYAHNLTQIPNEPNTRYWDGSSGPLYPFGFGLSYSNFSITRLRLSASNVAPGNSIQVSVDVKNEGDITADEVVQIYTHQRAGTMSRPVRELKGFRRITLAAGETRTVTITLDTKELGFWSTATRAFGIEPGTFDLWVGNSAECADNHTTFELANFSSP